MKEGDSALPKLALLRVRCVRREKDAWLAEAGRLGVTLSTLVRRTMNAACKGGKGTKDGR